MPKLAERIEALTAELVAIPSIDREEEVQQSVAAILQNCGFDCRFQEVAPGRPNLIASRGRSGPFICSHADVHPPHSQPDPWKCRRSGGLLFGRGVLDAKGQIAALLAAVEAAPDKEATVVITCDEETGGKGSELLELPDELRPARGGIVLEPTNLQVCVAQAGCIDIRLEAHGVPTHMATPGAGASAIDFVLERIESLKGCSFLNASHPLLPPPWLHIGRMTGGEHLWRLADHASAEVSITLLPGVDPQAARDEVDHRLNESAARFAGRGASATHEVLDVNEPIEVPADLPVADALQSAAGGSLPTGGMPSWTDAAHLLLKHNIPCVVFGAGDLSLAHSNREQVRLDDLVRLAEIISAVLRR